MAYYIGETRNSKLKFRVTLSAKKDVDNGIGRPLFFQAVELLIDEHIAAPDTAVICGPVSGGLTVFLTMRFDSNHAIPYIIEQVTDTSTADADGDYSLAPSDETATTAMADDQDEDTVVDLDLDLTDPSPSDSGLSTSDSGVG